LPNMTCDSHLTKALMKDDLPTLAAPSTYTLRPLRSRNMADATSEMPCPAGLPTKWALTTFRRRWPAVASSHSVTAAGSVPLGNRSTCNHQHPVVVRRSFVSCDDQGSAWFSCIGMPANSATGDCRAGPMAAPCQAMLPMLYIHLCMHVLLTSQCARHSLQCRSEEQQREILG